MPKIKREFVFVFGTRPEYERMEEIYKTFLEKKHEVRLFYIPQNQSKELENTLKNNYLKAEIFYKKERDLFSFIQITLFKNLKNNPVVFACSDTSTCLATAIFTKNFKIPLVKIDAGLRRGSFLLNEDKNSILSDHLADILFCSSEQNKTNLIKELLPEEKVFVSGTTLIKGLHIKIHEKNLYKEKNGPIIVSIHRKETLENQKNIWILLREIAKRNCLTKVILNKKNNLKIPRSKFIETMNPISRKSFLEMLSTSRLVITDSQNLQEEACFFGVPCITLLKNNNRKETIDCGHTRVLNIDSSKDDNLAKSNIRQTINETLKSKKSAFPFKKDIDTPLFIYNKIKEIIS